MTSVPNDNDNNHNSNGNDDGGSSDNSNGRIQKRSCCCRASRMKWATEKHVRAASNVLVVTGVLIALGFAIHAVTSHYKVSTAFIIGGTLFVCGGILLALVNVSWTSRRLGQRISAIQIVCNVVLLLIIAYLELIFWSYPGVAFRIPFAAGIPMFILVNIPSCFPEKQIHVLGEGETVCLEQDYCDDASCDIDQLDNTQQTEDIESAMPLQDVIVQLVRDDNDDNDAGQAEKSSYDRRESGEEKAAEIDC